VLWVRVGRRRRENQGVKKIQASQEEFKSSQAEVCRQGGWLGIIQQMRPVTSLKILLAIGYSLGYLLAVLPPMVIDPRLTSHAEFASRHYPNAILCAPIFVLLALTIIVLFNVKSSLYALYGSVIVYALSIIISLPIFRPEFPHGNLIAVGTVSGLLFAFTIFVWSFGQESCANAKSAVNGNDAALEYLKELLSFVRQATFAAIGVFSGLLYGVFTVESDYIQAIASSQSDKFLLGLNAAAQIAFYAIFAVAGPVRYLFLTSLRILSDFKEMAVRLDEATSTRSI
jgi:hypothetical protein